MKRIALAVFAIAVLATAAYGYGLYRYMNYWSDAYKAELIQSATVHIVAPGETLWQIARHYYPEADPRSVLSYVRWINNLEGADGPILAVGQRVLVPRFEPQEGP